MLRIPFGLSADSRGDTGAAGGVIMKLAIRVTDPGNNAKLEFLFSVFNVASDDQKFSGTCGQSKTP